MDKLPEIQQLQKLKVALKALKFYKKEFETAPYALWHDVAAEAIKIIEGEKTLEDLKDENYKS